MNDFQYNNFYPSKIQIEINFDKELKGNLIIVLRAIDWKNEYFCYEHFVDKSLNQYFIQQSIEISIEEQEESNKIEQKSSYFQSQMELQQCQQEQGFFKKIEQKILEEQKQIRVKEIGMNIEQQRFICQDTQQVLYQEHTHGQSEKMENIQEENNSHGLEDLEEQDEPAQTIRQLNKENKSCSICYCFEMIYLLLVPFALYLYATQCSTPKTKNPYFYVNVFESDQSLSLEIQITKNDQVLQEYETNDLLDFHKTLSSSQNYHYQQLQQNAIKYSWKTFSLQKDEIEKMAKLLHEDELNINQDLDFATIHIE
ncbi:hypothetical protein ABPG72_022349 [Tetrahymena utriculariae]